MGYYVPVGDNAVLDVLGVSMRPQAIFHSINCGSPEEVLTLELSVAANIYRRVSAALPGILDVTCQPFVLHTVVKIRPQYEGHARQVLMAVFGAEPTWAKTCTVVDEDVDVVLSRSPPRPLGPARHRRHRALRAPPRVRAQAHPARRQPRPQGVLSRYSVAPGHDGTEVRWA